MITTYVTMGQRGTDHWISWRGLEIGQIPKIIRADV